LRAWKDSSSETNPIRAGVRLMESLPILADNNPSRPRQSSVKGALDEVTLAGDFAQFGVYRGKSARIIHRMMSGDRRLHLFDSFEGLPENWTPQKPAGHFKLAPDEIPTFEGDNVIIHKGWFKDTVPQWAGTLSAPLAFLHIDADLYSSTVDVLFNLNDAIVPGTIILFDEYVLGRSDDEHRALLDWAAKFGRKFDYLWRTSGAQVCIRITA